MQIIASLIACFMLTATSATAAHSASAEHPIETVLALLKKLSETVDAEGQKEEASYKSFMTWCADSTSTLEKAIDESKEDIDSLYDTIKSNQQNIASLADEIAYLTQEITEKEAAGLSAKSTREAAAQLYADADKDYETTITAIGEAIAELTKAKPAALLDISRKLLGLPLVLKQLSDEQRDALIKAAKQSYVPSRNTSKVSEEDKEMRKQIKGVESYVGAGGTDYIFKSGSVVELLQNLEKHFKTEKLEATKAETNALNEYELAKKAREDAIKASTDLQKSKGTTKTDTEEELAKNKADLSDNKAELKADTDSLELTTESCAGKTAEWKQRSKTRLDELKALDQAAFILSQVTGVKYEKPTLTMLPTSQTLLQLDHVDSKVDDPKAKALQLLRAQAKKSRSRSFNEFVLRVASELQNSAKGSPFDEVINMIQKMIFRLMAEQKTEDEHKYWCDMETTKTQTSIDAKTAKVQALKSKVDEMKASIAVLINEIQEKTVKVADITKWAKEAKEVREDNKKENAAAIEDAQEAQAALTNAIAVIKKHYEGTGEIPIALTQEPAPVSLGEKPSTWSASYTGAADPTAQPSGIIAVLNKCYEDFAKMEEETKADDAADQVKYNELLRTNEIAKAEYMTLIQTNTEQKTRLVEKVQSTQEQLKHVQGELEATKQYYTDLGGACRDADSTYVERKSARADEIEALKEAQGILANALESLLQRKPAFLQQKQIRRVSF